MKKTIAILITFAISFTLYAQNEIDALRYSLIGYGGTARFMGLSGAYGAVGADFTSLSQNPAGIGLYRKSEFTITPVLFSDNTTATYLGQQNTDNRNAGYLGNIGFVYAQSMHGKAGPLVQLQYGFGLNQMSKFSNDMTISGFNNDNSLLNNYVDEVNYSGDPPSSWDDFGAGLAYDVNLIFYDSIDNRWAADMENGGIQQTRFIESMGSTNETVLSAGANIADKLFLGITFAFPFIRYESYTTHTENDVENLNSYYESFTRYEYLETRGSGFNFKAGVIVMPVKFIRIGGAVHTSTNYYNMSDFYYASMSSSFRGGEYYSDRSPDGFYDYELKTPLRALGSIAVLLGKYGLITADYEYIDYADSRLWAYDYSFINENNAIETQYTSANNLRFGAEVRASIFTLRGGYGMYGTPYKGESTMGERTGYSFGIGMRKNGMIIDFAYNHSSFEGNYYMYSGAPPSHNLVKTNLYSLTLGYRY